MTFFVKLSDCAVDSDGSSKGIDIGIFMSHDKDPFMGLYDLPESMSFYSCLHTGGFFKLKAFASEISGLVRIPDDDLVSAASQCQVDGASCELLAFKQG